MHFLLVVKMYVYMELMSYVECLQKLSLYVGQNPYGLLTGRGSRNRLKSMQFS